MRYRLAPLASALLCTVATPALSAGLLTLPTPQGTTPGNTKVLSLSGNGLVAGGSAINDSGEWEAAIWGFGNQAPDEAVFVNPASPSVSAVSNNGLYYLYSLDPEDTSVFREGFHYSLYAADGSLDGWQDGSAISDDGYLVVGMNAGKAAYWTFDPGAQSFGAAQSLPSLGGGNGSALALTPDGSLAAGYSLDGNFKQQAVVWSGAGFSSIQMLDPAAQFAESRAQAISDDGSTVVGFVKDGGKNVAALWSGAGYATLATVDPDGSTKSELRAVNADGSIAGGSYMVGGTSRAFLYADGKSGDLNTLLTDAGLDLTGILLTDIEGLSDDGYYIAVNSDDHGYVAYYDGEIGGLTSSEAQVLSLAGVAQQRAALLAQPGSYDSVLLGDLSDGDTGISAFGLYGSAAGGIKGTAAWNDTTVNAGLLVGSGDYGSVAYQGVMVAASLRQSFGEQTDLFRPFLEVGGTAGRLDALTFRRSYANGAGTATGIGTTDGYLASIFSRLGVEANLSDADTVTASAELAQHWLTTSAYSEVQSAANPFPGAFSDGYDASTSVKAAAGWTHRFNERADLTLRGAIGTTFNATSTLEAGLTGAGVAAVAPVAGYFAEGGLRLGWQATDAMKLDLYATGMMGEHIGMAGHIGAGLTVGF